MAENYKPGVRTIFYRSKQFKEGLTVTMEMLNPSRNWTTGIEFVEAGKGLYFVSFDFLYEGTYVALMYENGKKITSQNFFVSDDGPQSSDFTGLVFKGPSVINNH
jgi:hypothetical protein